MEEFVKGEILVLEFPFSNLKSSKRRPVLVLKVPKGDDIIVLQITGNSQEQQVEIEIDDKDFKKGSLNRKSFIRIDKIATIDRSLIKYKVGRISEDKFKEIISKICNYITK